MNNICIDCPRYNPEKAAQEDGDWYLAHYCAGCNNPVYTGCVRRPYNPLARVLNLVYNVDLERWEPAMTAPVHS